MPRCKQWIKKGKDAIKWPRLSCRTFAEPTPCGGLAGRPEMLEYSRQFGKSLGKSRLKQPIPFNLNESGI
jgi:hypothetical protein